VASPVRKDEQSITEVLGDLKAMTVDYAKQETVDPLRNLGREVGFGVVGSVFLGAGGVLLGLALLRALQTQTGTAFTGSLSWLPYVPVIVVLAAFAGLSVRAIFKDRREHESA
jgi:hypothetical protein